MAEIRIRRATPRTNPRAAATRARAVSAPRAPLPEPAAQVARYLANEVLNGLRSAPSTTSCDSDEVVLECERDGYRVLIVRQHTPAQPALNLSPREMEIARMITKGYANKTIASVLEISSWTVGTHLRRIFAKFAVTSRAAMVARLMASGYFSSGAQTNGSKRPVDPTRRVL